MQIEKNIAATLRYKLEEGGKTKVDFAKELGLPRSTFQGYLKGERGLRSDSIEEIAKRLGMSPAQLISGPEYLEASAIFGPEPILAALQGLHPQVQALARESVSLLLAAVRISNELNGLE